MLEKNFQAHLIRKLKSMFPGCVVLKNDSGYIQGIPDILVLYEHSWAALECKTNTSARHQPNQDYYINKLDEMSFASFISPETEVEVLHDLQQTFELRRSTCVSKC